jgi:hypothetical protein
MVNPTTSGFVRILSFIVIISSIYLATNRDTYLPFLGKTILPQPLTKSEKIPEGANVDYILNLNGYSNGSKVFYWGAKLNNKKGITPNPLDIYGDFTNSGISTVKNEKAIIKFYCPDKYSVKSSHKNNSNHYHDIHYRIECPDTGILSSIRTVKVEC